MFSKKEVNSTIFLNQFPEINTNSFSPSTYSNRFNDSSFIIHAFGKQIDYPIHWGVLSIKCAFRGIEYYESKNSFYAVNDPHFLIFNEGTFRSSYISSEHEVESFSISFSPKLIRSFLFGLYSSDDRILDNPFGSMDGQLEFTEKLYEHDNLVSPLLFKIQRLSEDWESNQGEIEELLSYLLESLTVKQEFVWNSMRNIAAVKTSTQKELYLRLNRARDYIFSSFKENLTTQKIASVACLNQHYFLREFKKIFKYTPHQYLQGLRLKEACHMLNTTDKMISEICNEVGFADLASFSKLFKKHFFSPPSIFRTINHRSREKNKLV